MEKKIKEETLLEAGVSEYIDCDKNIKLKIKDEIKKYILEMKNFDYKEYEKSYSLKTVVERKKLPVKYLDPETGYSWSGRGKTPLWLIGKCKEKYLINESDK